MAAFEVITEAQRLEISNLRVEIPAWLKISDLMLEVLDPRLDLFVCVEIVLEGYLLRGCGE